MAHPALNRNDTVIRSFADLRGKVLIVGGSFDPVHSGHTGLAQRALEQLGLDSALFIPLNINPLKGQNPGASSQHRLMMLKVALDADPRMFISTYELERSGKSYTIDTLRYIRSECAPSVSLYFALGSENVKDLRRWKDWEKLWDYAELIPVGRNPKSAEDLSQYERDLSREKIERLKQHFLQFANQASSTSIRDAISNGKTEQVQCFLEPGVVSYITENSLYSPDNLPNT